MHIHNETRSTTSNGAYRLDAKDSRDVKRAQGSTPISTLAPQRVCLTLQMLLPVPGNRPLS